jgi:AcrR family transcriptional regulator
MLPLKASTRPSPRVVMAGYHLASFMLAARAQVRAAILRTARELIEERSFSRVGVNELMAGTGMGRTAFYRYFDDQESVLLALLEEAVEDLQAASQVWLDDQTSDIDQSLRASIAAYSKHAPLLRSAAELMVTDERIRDRYLAAIEDFVTAVERRIKREQQRAVRPRGVGLVGVQLGRPPARPAAPPVWGERAARGLHAARRGTRFEALEPLRQGVRAHFGGYREGAAVGLALRHDHGSAFMSDLFQSELAFLGVTSRPAFVREPEGNGCAERFVRTRKEQLLWLQPFATVDELEQALLAFKDRYNHQWLIARHGHRTPAAARAAFTAPLAA